MREVEILQLLPFALVGLGAAFVQRVSGFGLGIFAMLFLPYMLPSHTAAATISCIFSCVTSTYNACKYRKNIPFRTVLPMLAAALVAIPVAVSLAQYVSQRLFQILLGTVLIGLSIYFLWVQGKLSIKPTPLSAVCAGALGGTLNGLFSTGGPPVVLYMTHAADDNLTYFAGVQFYFALTNIYATAVRFLTGVVDAQILPAAAVGLIGCLIGDWLGTKIFHRLDAKRLKQIIYIGMILSGILMIL